MSTIPLTVPLCRPLSGPLLRPVSGVDPDARAYVAAVQTAGVTVSSSQRDAISDFIAGEKAAGRWSLLKRLYLPIWANATANAIDVVSLVSGVFVGGITHGAGYMKPNGTTGYFRSDLSPLTAGLTTTSGAVFALCPSPDTRADTRYLLGTRDPGDSGETSLYQGTGTAMSSFVGRMPGVEVAGGVTANNSGVLVANRRVGGLKFSQRTATGTIYGANQPLVASTVSSLVMWAGGLNNGGSFILPTDARFGAMGFGMGFATDADVDGFTLALQNLWSSIAITDPDASAYLQAVQATGVAVPLKAKMALNDFVAAERTAGRWGNIGRMYLPIWGAAAANAICVKTRTAGSFIGTSTHAAGYIKGDGGTGRYLTGTTLPSVGVTDTSLWMGALIKAQPSFWPSPFMNAVTTAFTDWASGGLGMLFDHTNATGGRQDNDPATMVNGILSGFVSGTNQQSRVRTAAGIVADQTRVTGVMSPVSTSQVEIMGVNAWNHSDAQFGAWWFGTGVSAADDAAFTLNLKALWETATALTLP